MNAGQGRKVEGASQRVVKILSWWLQRCPKIQRMNIHGVDGMHLTVKAIENLEKFEKICSLELRDFNLSKGAMKRLLDFFQLRGVQIKHLDLQRIGVVGNVAAFFAKIFHLPSLKRLSVRSPRSPFAVRLKRCPIQHLSRLPNPTALKFLKLGITHRHETWGFDLGAFVNLEEIEFEGVGWMRDEVMSCLQGKPKLRIIRIEPITRQAIQIQRLQPVMKFIAELPKIAAVSLKFGSDIDAFRELQTALGFGPSPGFIPQLNIDLGTLTRNSYYLLPDLMNHPVIGSLLIKDILEPSDLGGLSFKWHPSLKKTSEVLTFLSTTFASCADDVDTLTVSIDISSKFQARRFWKRLGEIFPNLCLLIFNGTTFNYGNDTLENINQFLVYLHRAE